MVRLVKGTGAPIQRKLTRMALLTCGAALLVTTTLFFVSELIAIRQANLQQLKILSEAIASNSTAALAFENPDDARSVLAAFKADTHIVAAALYDKHGQLFVSYPEPAPAESIPAIAGPPGFGFEHSALVGVTTVTENARQLGTLFVRSDLSAIYERLEFYAGLAAIVIALALLAAYAISRHLQRQLSMPILALAATAKGVSEQRDYSLRAERAGIQELDVLTDAFNQMLAQTGQYEGRLNAQVQRLALLQEITHGIGSRHDLRSMFQIVLGTLEENLAIDFCCVCLHETSSASIVINTVGPASLPHSESLGLREQDVAAVDGELARCMRGALVYEPDVRQIALPFPQRFSANGFHSLVISPLMVESHVFGALVTARRQEHGFSSTDCEFLKQLSEHVALATHQAQLYVALQQAYDDLRQSQQTVMQQERLRALGEMASGIAHDINNAISPVSLYTELLLEKEPNLSAEARGRLQTIQRAVEDVAGTIGRMREFYRPREAAANFSKVDVNRAINQVVELTEPRWRALPEERGIVIELRRDLTDPVPPIDGDEVEVRDALTNLVFNAVDAMPEGGTLILRTHGVTRGDGRQEVHVEVCDTGVGMNDEARRRCLEPFFTTKGERGTGLGLASVYGMIQRHNGELEIDSAVGKGTTMRMIFPAQTANLAATTGTYIPSQLVTRRLRILLIDDDPVLIRSLQDALESDGHQVKSTSGGQAGIDAFTAAHGTANAFTVVITDLGMPRIDGRRVASAIKTLSPATPVIMLTGWGQRLLAENDIPADVNRVLSKPPRLPQLRAAFAELID